MLCVAVLVISSFFVVDGALAQPQETCDQCKYLRCLKSSVAQKQALVAIYQGLYDFWKGRHVDDAGHPLEVRNLSALSEPERSRIYDATMNHQLAEFYEMAEIRTAAVSAAEGCGYPEKMPANPSTESFETCQTHNLPGAQAVQPCKELAQLLQSHEALHVTACRQRQQPNSSYWPYTVAGASTKMYPPKIITPAGLAAEEIRAYQLEITALKRIIEKLEKRCRKISFKDVTVECVMPAGKYRVRMGQKLEGSACGDPTRAPWTITPKYFAEGLPGMPPVPATNNKAFTTDCLAAGSDLEKQRAEILRSHPQQGGGWMCVYHEGPPPQISIRFFRLSRCEGPTEVTITVDAEVSETCEASQESAPPPAPAPSPAVKPAS